MTDDELNRALAEVMGWKHEWHKENRPGQCAAGLVLPHWHDERGVRKMKHADFAQSLDALRDGPERLLREAGWQRSSWITPHRDERACWVSPDHLLVSCCQAYSERHETEAEARVRAALAALQALAAAKAEVAHR